MSTPSRAEIKRITATSFADQLRRSPYEHGHLILDWLDSADRALLPNSNDDILINAVIQMAKDQAGLVEEIRSLRVRQTLSMWSQKKSITYGMLDSTHLYLPFSAITGLSIIPTSVDDFELFKAGEAPLWAGEAYSISGAGILFATAWESGDTGQIWVRNAGLADALLKYRFTGSQFTGSPSVCDLNALGVSRIPSNGNYFIVYAGPQLLTEGTSYTYSSGVITFTFDVPSDQNVQVWILPE